MSEQYHFPIPQREAMSAEDFMIAASNREAAAWILERATTSWPRHCLVLHGPEGCGKTHLLTAWAGRNTARRVAAGENVTGDVVSGSASIKALALDGADNIGGNAALEEWLKHLFDATEGAKMPLLLTAQKPPKDWALGLKDIESRLKSCPAIEIKEPDDELMRGLLVKLFADRQLLVEAEVIDYLVSRLERTGTAVRRTVKMLDEKALASGRKITVPFVQSVL